ncbi:zf-TFIIB domain-containing protein [Solirubrobacter sp. CPCC 204708]|uniref:Zf-TFIIB domain-containing protein n=1 Tax=Solirubrobacter deserti TaxID=2282478 RepID=A0ABT4REC1_9ACTN|nr:zf-TFIIB domain-containing protein [Solirubrobacter deserti]MBE2316117.1 zf-TFIIB domain-containing protein [Solirubrobacter deserti]MDA0136867.1 zf-TFIIB domain-containing protein [Solirubrobacter deserti]
MPAQGPCPNCNGQLVQVERSGVHIDACRQCRGVFLDRGELDEILKRERQYVASAHDDDEEFFREVSGKPQKQQSYGMDAQSAMKLFKDYQSHKSHKSKHRKKSVLDELFG